MATLLGLACIALLEEVVEERVLDEAADAALDVLVAGEPRLGLAGDGVDVRRADGGGEAHLGLAGPLQQLAEQEARPGLAMGVDDGVEAVEPLGRFTGVGVGELIDVAVEDHVDSL